MRIHGLLGLSLAATLALAGVATAPAHAQPARGEVARADARRHFQQGVTAYAARDWSTALEEFQAAYRLAPHPAVRVNMANCYVALGRPVEALHHFERFLEESPGAPAAQRQAIERQLATLRAQVADVTVTVAAGPAGPLHLAATIDGTAVTPAAGALVRVVPGHHTMEVSADGYVTSRREFDATPGGSADLSLTLDPEPAPAPPSAPVGVLVRPPFVAASPVPPRDTHRGPSPGFFYASVGVTSVAALGWAVCGALALGANGSFNAAATANAAGQADATLRQRGLDDAARARQFALWSDVAMGVTLAGAVASILLFFKTDFGRRVQLSAALDRAGAALTVGGRFE